MSVKTLVVEKNTRPVRVVCVGRWKLQAVRLLAEGAQLAAVFHRAEEAIRRVAWEEVDVAAVRDHLPDMESLACLGRLRRLAPEVRVIVTCEPLDEAHALLWLMAGAAGCVARDPSAAELARACVAVVETGLYLPPRALERALRAVLRLRLVSRLAADLTPREVDVLIGVLLGASIKDLGGWLGIAASTVKTHLGRLFAAAGVGNRADLVKRILHTSPKRAPPGTSHEK